MTADELRGVDRTFDDLYALNALVCERSGVVQRHIRGWLALCAIPIVAGSGYACWRTGDPRILLAPAVVGSGLFLLFPPIYRRVFRWATRRNLRRMLGGGAERTHHRLSSSDEGLRDLGSDGELLTPWSSVREVVRSERHLFCFVGAASAHVVPLRAFASPDDAEAFAREVERRRDAEHPRPSAEEAGAPSSARDRRRGSAGSRGASRIALRVRTGHRQCQTSMPCSAS